MLQTCAFQQLNNITKNTNKADADITNTAVYLIITLCCHHLVFVHIDLLVRVSDRSCLTNNLALFASPVLFNIVNKPNLLHCILHPVLIDGMMPSSALYMISPRHGLNKQGYSKYTCHMPTIVENDFHSFVFKQCK